MAKMFHPEHGYTHTDPFNSEESLKKHGWINHIDAVIEQEEDAQEEFAVEQVRAKRGRPFKKD